MSLVPDDHDPDEDASYMELRVHYNVSPETVDGQHPMSLGLVEAHIHHVPDSLVVDTFLTLAREALKRAVSHNMFNENVPDEVRQEAAAAMATSLLVDRLRSDEFSMAKVSRFEIPDDARELFESGGPDERKGWPYA